MRFFSTLIIIAVLSVLQACQSSESTHRRGAIVLGDPTTIVTETNPAYLSDNVADFELPKEQVQVEKPTVVEEPVATEAPAVAEPKAEVAAEVPHTKGGLDVPFVGMPISMSNMQARTGRQVDWHKARGASYTTSESDFNGKMLSIKSAHIIKVMQRYQTVLLVQTNKGKSYKLNLPTSTSDWQTLKGSNGNYAVSGLAKNQLKYGQSISPAALKKAIQKLARVQRLNHKEEEQLMRSIRNVHQAPCVVALQSVVWKISAKDASGKPLERELRIDVNH
jgi:hypothetical protein